jgi:hypothetical protein
VVLHIMISVKVIRQVSNVDRHEGRLLMGLSILGKCDVMSCHQIDMIRQFHLITMTLCTIKVRFFYQLHGEFTEIVLFFN